MLGMVSSTAHHWVRTWTIPPSHSWLYPGEKNIWLLKAGCCCNLHTPGDSLGCISAERLPNQHVSYGATSDTSNDWKVEWRAANVAWFRKTGYASSPRCSRTAADWRQIPTGNHGTCGSGQCRKVHSDRLLSL